MAFFLKLALILFLLTSINCEGNCDSENCSKPPKVIGDVVNIYHCKNNCSYHGICQSIFKQNHIANTTEYQEKVIYYFKKDLILSSSACAMIISQEKYVINAKPHIMEQNVRPAPQSPGKTALKPFVEDTVSAMMEFKPLENAIVNKIISQNQIV
jgi:hypothetical protein